jgi:hypothetical protein
MKLRNSLIFLKHVRGDKEKRSHLHLHGRQLHIYKDKAHGLKGTVSPDFRPSVFFIKQYPWAPDLRAKAFFNINSNSRLSL